MNTFEHGFRDELEKIAKKGKTSCPGSKLRSKGKGRGMGRGEGKGPIGIPIGEKKAGNSF